MTNHLSSSGQWNDNKLNNLDDETLQNLIISSAENKFGTVIECVKLNKENRHMLLIKRTRDCSSLPKYMTINSKPFATPKGFLDRNFYEGCYDMELKEAVDWFTQEVAQLKKV